MNSRFFYEGPKRYKPKYSEEYIKAMPSCFTESFVEENRAAEVKENKHSILLIPRPYSDFISK